jgi:hypothetical protein
MSFLHSATKPAARILPAQTCLSTLSTKILFFQTPVPHKPAGGGAARALLCWLGLLAYNVVVEMKTFSCAAGRMF